MQPYKLEDEDELRAIHARYFSHEFSFPDFLNGFHGAFTIRDNQGIIASGGVRPIAEIIVVSNQERDVYDRRAALLQILDGVSYIAGKTGYSELHAFVQSESWEQRLIKNGFLPTKGKSLVLEL